MAVHSISVKELISRIKLVFPSAPENYILIQFFASSRTPYIAVFWRISVET